MQLGNDQPLIGEKPNLTKSKALKNIFDLSIFTIIAMLFNQAYGMINTIYLGWSDNQAVNLAAVGLGMITTNMFSLSFSFTFNGALSTLVA